MGPITKKGQYLQAAPCSSISGPCREKERGGCYFFRSRQRSAPAPIARMRSPRSGHLFSAGKAQEAFAASVPGQGVSNGRL